MPHHLFIVSRFNPYLAEYLRERFSREADVQVLTDRRRRERRQSTGATALDRRRAERRSRPHVADDLRVKSHAFVTVS